MNDTPMKSDVSTKPITRADLTPLPSARLRAILLMSANDSDTITLPVGRARLLLEECELGVVAKARGLQQLDDAEAKLKKALRTYYQALWVWALILMLVIFDAGWL